MAHKRESPSCLVSHRFSIFHFPFSLFSFLFSIQRRLTPVDGKVKHTPVTILCAIDFYSFLFTRFCPVFVGLEEGQGGLYFPLLFYFLWALFPLNWSVYKWGRMVMSRIRFTFFTYTGFR